MRFQSTRCWTGPTVSRRLQPSNVCGRRWMSVSLPLLGRRYERMLADGGYIVLRLIQSPSGIRGSYNATVSDDWSAIVIWCWLTSSVSGILRGWVVRRVVEWVTMQCTITRRARTIVDIVLDTWAGLRRRYRNARTHLCPARHHDVPAISWPTVYRIWERTGVHRHVRTIRVLYTISHKRVLATASRRHFHLVIFLCCRR